MNPDTYKLERKLTSINEASENVNVHMNDDTVSLEFFKVR